MLRPAGFYEQRADQLKALLDAVAEANEEREAGPFGKPAGDLTLDFLHEMGDEEAEASLALGDPTPLTARLLRAAAMR